MSERFTYGTSQLFNFAEDSYLERTSRPFYSLIFILPFIVFYEVGTFLTSTDVLHRAQERVVAFIWLQSILDRYFGLNGKLAWAAPIVAVVMILIGLQLASRKKWHFNAADFGPMSLECVLLAVPLIVLSLFLSGPAMPHTNRTPSSGSVALLPGEAAPGLFHVSDKAGATIYVFSQEENHPHPDKQHRDEAATQYHKMNFGWQPQAQPGDGRLSHSWLIKCATMVTHTGRSKAPGQSIMANIVTGIGAGIYEELIFRLILICLLIILFQDIIGLGQKDAVVLAVLISAALFSAHHHVVFINGRLASGSPFNWREFSFRTIAGVYFAGLFAIRGFGITAGTHAFYDIIATFINATFFTQ